MVNLPCVRRDSITEITERTCATASGRPHQTAFETNTKELYLYMFLYMFWFIGIEVLVFLRERTQAMLELKVFALGPQWKVNPWGSRHKSQVTVQLVRNFFAWIYYKTKLLCVKNSV